VQSVVTYAFLTYVKVNLLAENGTSHLTWRKMCAREPNGNTLLNVYFTPTVH